MKTRLRRARCASHTYANTGAAIEKAIKAAQRRALLAYPAQVRRRRKPAVWKAMYEAAMVEKART